MANTFFDRFSALCKEYGETPNSVAKQIGASSGSVTAWKKGAAPRNLTLTKIADYFHVTTDFLLGKAEYHANVEKKQREVNDEDIKFALFGGSGEITDEMYEEVRSFAAYIMQREANRKKE